MAETAILNPVPGVTPGTHDNWNPDYGYTRRSATNGQQAKSRLGSWYQRDTLNAGYSFDLQWIARPWTTMVRIKQFYENFKGGYFTYIDRDAGGRHHVGRFTTAPNPVQVANGKWNLQGMLFEEIPQARMLQYPADFANWGRTLNVVDDNLVPTVATYAAPGGGGAWLAIVDPAIAATASATDPSAYVMYNASPNQDPANRDWAQMQYVGWGFELNFRTSPSIGACDIWVDGVLWQSDANLYGTGAPLVVSNTKLPLDVHRVKILPYGFAQTRAQSAAIAGEFPQMRVIV